MLVRNTCAGMVIRYFPGEDTLSVNGNHLIRSVPAKILRHMVRAYVLHGRCEFEYREFMRDDSIVADPLNPNLAVRMRRLSRSLESKCPAIRLRLTSKGKVRLEASDAIEYVER